MAFAERSAIFAEIEKQRASKVLLYVTSDRPGMDGQISNDAFDYFVHHLDKMWPEKETKISLILHTSGGDTSAAWRIVNLIRMYCDELEVIIPNKAHSAGTLISLGSDRIIMTKQATLGPIDPSISGPLGPQVPNNPNQRVGVSVEAVQGYLDIAEVNLSIKDDQAMSDILRDLSKQVHPLVLGQIFRIRNQIRSLAESLITHQKVKSEEEKKIIDFLCSDSGSHDRTINRREAKHFGLKVDKPSEDLYKLINDLYEDFVAEMEIRSAFNPGVLAPPPPKPGQQGPGQSVRFQCPRILIESVIGGSTRRTTEGSVQLMVLQQQAAPGMPPAIVRNVDVNIDFEGWRQL